MNPPWQDGQGHMGTPEHITGKAPSPQGPGCSVPGASELELQRTDEGFDF